MLVCSIHMHIRQRRAVSTVHPGSDLRMKLHLSSPQVTEAVELARLELGVQTAHWGSVEWAHDIEGADTTARAAAGVMFVHCSSAQSTTRTKLL